MVIRAIRGRCLADRTDSLLPDFAPSFLIGALFISHAHRSPSPGANNELLYLDCIPLTSRSKTILPVATGPDRAEGIDQIVSVWFQTMKRILVTGATGNVGRAVIKALLVLAKQHSIIAGVRNIETDRKTFAGTPIQFQHFDFEDEKTFYPAFSGCDILFLLRPPQISYVQKYFTPLIESAKKCNIEHVVFLSVQGVEKSRIIPHYKIEKLRLSIAKDLHDGLGGMLKFGLF